MCFGGNLFHCGGDYLIDDEQKESTNDDRKVLYVVFSVHGTSIKDENMKQANLCVPFSYSKQIVVKNRNEFEVKALSRAKNRSS